MTPVGTNAYDPYAYAYSKADVALPGADKAQAAIQLPGSGTAQAAPLPGADKAQAAIQLPGAEKSHTMPALSGAGGIRGATAVMGSGPDQPVTSLPGADKVLGTISYLGSGQGQVEIALPGLQRGAENFTLPGMVNADDANTIDSKAALLGTANANGTNAADSNAVLPGMENFSGANGTNGTNSATDELEGTGSNDTTKKAGYKSSPAECETCKRRKYQDGSNESVSYKSASHISPAAAGSAVRAHEGEHVANAYSRASQNGGKVVSATVTIHTAVCPECGRVYVSGGQTNTMIRYTDESNPYQQDAKTQDAIRLAGANLDKVA